MQQRRLMACPVCAAMAQREAGDAGRAWSGCRGAHQLLGSLLGCTRCFRLRGLRRLRRTLNLYMEHALELRGLDLARALTHSGSDLTLGTPRLGIARPACPRLLRLASDGRLLRAGWDRRRVTACREFLVGALAPPRLRLRAREHKPLLQKQPMQWLCLTPFCRTSCRA